MVSIRSLTAPFCLIGRWAAAAAPWQSGRRAHDSRDVVPPRPPARRQPGPARRRATADGVLPLFVLDPALWGPAGVTRRALPRRVAARARRLAPAARRAGCPSYAATRCARSSLAAQRGRREPGARRRRLRPLRPRARRARSRRRWPTHGIELVRTGSPYAVAPGRVTQRLRRRPTRSSRRSRRAWPEHGWRDAGRRAGRRDAGWRLDEHRRRSPTPELPAGLELPEAGEAAALRAVARRTSTSSLADYDDERDRPDLDATSRMSVHLKWGEIHPRTMLADLRGRTGKGAATYRTRARLAGVLRRRAVPAPGDRAGVPPPRVRARCRTTSPGEQLDAWREGRTGFPIVDAGMRQLRADRLDAQPGADDRRQLPGQGPAPRVAARRPALHAAGWSTATSPPTSTAGSGRPAAAPTRRRTSGSSTRPRRARSSTPTATTSAAGCPSSRRADQHVHEPSATRTGADGYPDADRRPRRGAARGAGALREDHAR